MPERHPVEAAVDLARAAVTDPDPAPAALTRMVRRFAAVRFAVSDDPDADGFLFQYGSVNWFAEPTFVLNVARQLEVLDPGGEHDHYVQIQFEFRYDLDADLDLAGRHSEWWFPGAGEPLETWLAAIDGSPILSLLAGRPAREFLVWQDQV
jgi:hypothetical protein